MRSILHKLILAPALIAAAALGTNTAMAAESTVKVPFGFTVAGKYCPAGTYTVLRDTIQPFVTLKGKEAPVSFNWVLVPGEPEPTDTKVTLRFDAVGQGYALRTVQYGPRITRQLDKGISEHSPVRTVEGQ
jgi:hypothetical protein